MALTRIAMDASQPCLEESISNSKWHEQEVCAGWHEFSDIHPNAAHEGLARLQQRGWVDALVTQNVDRLHSKAGATDVIELHGTTHRCASRACSAVHVSLSLPRKCERRRNGRNTRHRLQVPPSCMLQWPTAVITWQPVLCRVICMGCGRTSPRQPFQDLLAELNPGAADYVQRLIRAGHDAEAARQRSLCVGSTSEEARQVSDDEEVMGSQYWPRPAPCTACACRCHA